MSLHSSKELHMHCQDWWKSSQQHPNQPQVHQVLHHQRSLPFYMVNPGKNQLMMGHFYICGCGFSIWCKLWVQHIRLTVVPPQSLKHQSHDHKVWHIRLTVTSPQSPTHQTDSHMVTKSKTSDRQSQDQKVQHIRLTQILMPPMYAAIIMQPTSMRMAFSIRDGITKHFLYVFKLIKCNPTLRLVVSGLSH